MSKLFVCINLMVEGVGNIVYIFNRRPIVFKSDGLWNRSTQGRTPIPLLCSLSGKYPWERYEPPYPPSYGLNSTTTVLLGEWLWY